MRADYVASAKIKLRNFSKFLGSNPWFAGSEVFTCQSHPSTEPVSRTVIHCDIFFNIDYVCGFSNV